MSDDRRLAQDIDAEIADHLERRVRELRASGLTEMEARAQAAREFGDRAETRRALLSIDARIERRRRPRVWSGLGSDLRTGVRRLAGQPGATALTILTLALAIGVAAAVFSIVDQLILRPPPFVHADRLVDVWSQTKPHQFGGSALTPQKILGWQQQPALFDRLEGSMGALVDLTGSAEPERLVARIVSVGLLDMLGIRMHIGRPFVEGDGRPGSEKVAILSHAFWVSRFGGSPAILGSRIVLNDEPYTVVGVLRTQTMLWSDDEAIWLPFDLKAAGADASAYRFWTIGRLNAAVDADAAAGVAAAVADELGRTSPIRGTWHLGIAPKRSAQLESSIQRTLLVLLGAVILLLLIACANVTSFALGQALRRERELRLRAAIGASKWRLLRESLVETLALAIAAGLAAAVIAQAALAALLAAVPDGYVFMMTRPLKIDLRVLAIMTAVTLTVGLAAGLLPGIRSSRVDLSSALRDGTRGSERGLSFGAGIGGLVVVEVALAMVLLVGAVLMARTLVTYHRIEPGFDVDRLMTANVSLPSHRYPTEQARRDFFAALDAALRRQPGIEASAYAWGLPPEAGYGAGVLQAEGQEPLPGEREYFANSVSASYFETTGTRILAGRSFTPSDTDDHVILSEALARLLWGHETAVGKRMRETSDGRWLTVVGVAGSIESQWEPGQRADLQMYSPLALDVSEPIARVGRAYVTRMLIVRASQPALVPAAVREQVRRLDPLQPVGRFTSGTEIYAEPFAQQRFLFTVMGAFAGTALALAAMGIYGVLSQAVTRRRREIGIRAALGGGHARLIRMLVGRGIALAATGAAIGAAASMAGVRTLESLLVGVSPFDLVSFAAVVVLLMVVALVACWWPTRRALAIEPADVLRSE